MTSIEQNYVETADKLTQRILDLIPTHPDILNLDDVWALFKIPGFHCDDIDPSYAQACWSLGKAKLLYRDSKIEVKS